MKKLTRNVIIMAVVTVIMAVVLGLYIKYTGTVPAADNAASLTDGILSACQGFFFSRQNNHKLTNRSTIQNFDVSIENIGCYLVVLIQFI